MQKFKFEGADRDYLINLYIETVRRRKLRKIGRVELYVSVLPDDIPSIDIQKVEDTRKGFIIWFKPTNEKEEKYKETNLKKEPDWVDPKGIVKIFKDPVYRYIRKIEISGNPEEALVSIEQRKEELERKLNEGEELSPDEFNELDLTERQLEGVARILEHIEKNKNLV